MKLQNKFWNRQKKVLTILLIVLLLPLGLGIVVFSGARLYLHYSGPLNHEGDTWVSEDGKITIVAQEHQCGRGKMQRDNEVIEFKVSQGAPDGFLSITYPGVNTVSPGVYAVSEVWEWNRKGTNQYDMTVIYSYTEYFVVGETITFYRSDGE